MLTAFFVAALAAGADQAPAKKVEFFEGTYADATAKAGEKKLPLFVDFFTVW